MAAYFNQRGRVVFVLVCVRLSDLMYAEPAQSADV